MAYDISKAELEIAKILEEVERETGSVVESVFLDDIEVTTIESTRQELARRVRLEVKRLPGTNWHTGQPS